MFPAPASPPFRTAHGLADIRTGLGNRCDLLHGRSQGLTGNVVVGWLPLGLAWCDEPLNATSLGLRRRSRGIRTVRHDDHVAVADVEAPREPHVRSHQEE